jgi:hypothetical protein
MERGVGKKASRMSDVELNQRVIMGGHKRGGETEIGVIGYFPAFRGCFPFSNKGTGL